MMSTDLEHNWPLLVTISPCRRLPGKCFHRPSSKIGKSLDGADVVRDKNSDATIDYLNGPGVDNKIWQKGATQYFFSQDHLGSTTALTNASGVLVERETYDAYGNTAGSALTRYGYTGRERDSVTGLQYNRARWYDAQVGRFVSEDPIGFTAGLDWYSYVLNNPINLKDPFGLWETDAHNEIIDQAFRHCLNEQQRQWLKDASRWVDRFDNQFAETAYQHGMRASWETVDQASKKANDFVGHYEALARNDFPKGCKDGYGRIPWNALWEIGKALHTIMDMTSLSHEGFQIWYDPPESTGSLWDIPRAELYALYVERHHAAETKAKLLADPNRLRSVKQKVRDEFNKVFGDCGCCND